MQDKRRCSAGMPHGRCIAMLTAVAMLSAPLASSAPAWAQAKGAAAKSADKKAAAGHFKKGKEAFEKKDFREAKVQFKAADDILPAAAAEYYIARCHEELSEFADAAAYFQKALDDGKLKPEQADEAKSRLAALRSRPARVKVTSEPAGANLVVDGRPVPDKTPTEIDLAPGVHKISIQAPGKTTSNQEVDVVPFVGATVTARLEAAAVATPPPDTVDPGDKHKVETPPPDKVVTPPDTDKTEKTVDLANERDKGEPTTPPTEAPARDMTWVYVTGGAGLAALGVGTFFGIKTLSDKKKYDKSPTQSLHSQGTRDALISDIGIGIGITCLVTSAVLYFTAATPGEAGKPSAATRSRLSIAPVITLPKSAGPSFAGAAAAFEF